MRSFRSRNDGPSFRIFRTTLTTGGLNTKKLYSILYIIWVSRVWWHHTKWMPTQHHNSYSKSGCHIVLHSSCFFVFAQKSHYNYKKSKRVTLQIRPVYSDAIIEQDDTVTAVKQCVAKAHGQLKKKKQSHKPKQARGSRWQFTICHKNLQTNRA